MANIAQQLVDQSQLQDPLGSPLHSNTDAAVAAQIHNDESGYEKPRDVKLDPLLSIPNIESFDYEGALKAGLTPTQILDNMQYDDSFSKDFDFEKARKAIPDDNLVAMMSRDSEKSKVNLARSKAYHAGIDNDFTLGLLHANTGIQATLEDMKFWKSDEEQDKAISKIQDFAKDLSRARSDKDFISAFTAGDVAGQIGVLPIAAQSRIATGAIESVLGYASGRAEGSKEDAAISGAISGTAGVAIAHMLRGANGAISKDIKDKLQDTHLTTDEAKAAFRDYKKEWDKVIDVEVERPSINPFSSKEFSVNPRNPYFYKANDDTVKEIAATIDFLKGPGAIYKNEASDASLKAQHSIRNIRQQRIDSVNNVLNTVKQEDLHSVGNAINKGINIVSSDYQRLRDSLGIVHTDNTHLSTITDEFDDKALELLDEAVRPDVRALKELISDNTVNSLMDANVLLNKIIRRTGKSGRAKKFKLGELKDKINTQIADTVGPSKFSEYKAMDRDYSIMASVRDSKVGDAVLAATKGTITPEDALRQINKVSGKELFKDIETLIGTKEAEKLELLTMKGAFANSASPSWSALGKQIDTKGFITPEGKALRETIQKFAELFNVDNLVTDAIGKGELLQGGAKSDVRNQVAGTFWHTLMTSIQKKIPITDAGKRGVQLDHAIDVLKSPQTLKSFVDKAEQYNKPMAHREIQNIIQQLPKSPEPRPGGVVDIPKGKPLNIFTTKAIQEGSEEAFKDAIFSKLSHSDSNKVLDEAFKFFDGTRLPEKMEKIGNALQEGKVAHNAKLLDAAIKGEAELMYKAIRKDAGLDPNVVDKDMMKSLITHVMSNQVKECK